MKLCGYTDFFSKLVAPHTGAWIETALNRLLTLAARVAPHTGAWIETSIKPRDF